MQKENVEGLDWMKLKSERTERVGEKEKERAEAEQHTKQNTPKHNEEVRPLCAVQ